VWDKNDVKDILDAVDGLFANTNGISERGRTVPMGEWTAVPFANTNFTSSSGTWVLTAGDQAIFQYTVIGKTMTVVFQLNQTTVTGTPAQLQIAIPGGFSAAFDTVGTAAINHTGNWELGNIVIGVGSVIGLQPVPLGVATWSSGTNTIYVRGSITFPVA
jgi:hypothetical protein